MKVTQQLQELERLARTLDVKVSYEPTAGLMAGAGGLCRLHGGYRLILDRRLKPGARVQVLADALARFDTQAVELDPAIQALLERARESGKHERLIA